MGFLKSLLLALLLVGGSSSALSQSLLDSKGKDFWIAFPPNDHSGFSSPKLVVYVAAEQPTVATFAARRRTGEINFNQQNIQAGTITKIEFDVDDYELRGTNDRGTNTGDCELAMPMSIHVITNMDVTCYASTRDVNTSDAWLVLPTRVLGTDYRVVSYASDATTNRVFGRTFIDNAYPSQFLVVASEDDTQVEIDLSIGETSTGVGRTRAVTLNAGESYLVQAQVSVNAQNDDLTGTRVRATKPIGLLGSHFRAQVPVLNDGASRDVLAEQIPPVDTWGRSFVAPPLEPPADSQQDGQTDVTVLRILTHLDSTFIRVDGLPPFLIVRAGSTWDMPLTDRGRSIETDQPVLVSIIDRTTFRGGGGGVRDGDPSLTIVPPSEQYLRQYLVVSIEPETQDPFYTAHYLTMTARMEATGLIFVDGVQAQPLTEIRSSGFGYVHVPVAAGQHVVTSDSTVGVIAYGYGPAESYGYTGGMAFERLYQPSITLRVLDAVAAPGDSVRITTVIDTITEESSLIALAPSELHGSISYDRSLFVPNDKQPPATSFRGSISFILEIDSLAIGDTVSIIRGRAALGMLEIDSLRLDSIRWTTASSIQLAILTKTIDGQLTIDELCRTGGRTRLFNPHETLPMVERYYDLVGRERQKLEPGWNVIVRSQGDALWVTRKFVSQ